MIRSPVALAGIYTLGVGLACYGWFVPAKMPPDYDAIFSISIPIAVVGTFIFPFVVFGTMWNALSKRPDA